MKSWQLKKAKAHLNQLIQETIMHGPQEIISPGEPAVVIISKKEFDKISQTKTSFLQFLRQSPLVGAKIKLTRNPSLY